MLIQCYEMEESKFLDSLWNYLNTVTLIKFMEETKNIFVTKGQDWKQDEVSSFWWQCGCRVKESCSNLVTMFSNSGGICSRSPFPLSFIKSYEIYLIKLYKMHIYPRFIELRNNMILHFNKVLLKPYSNPRHIIQHLNHPF